METSFDGDRILPKILVWQFSIGLTLNIEAFLIYSRQSCKAVRRVVKLYRRPLHSNIVVYACVNRDRIPMSIHDLCYPIRIELILDESLAVRCR